MKPIDWNNKSNARRSSWGRFGEPDESCSPQVHSLKLPKRRGSFDGSDSSHSDDDEKPKQPTLNKTMCSPTMMLASPAKSSSIPRSNSSGNFGRQGRLRRRSFCRPSFEKIPSIEGSRSFSNSNSNAAWTSNSNSNFDYDDDYLCQKAAQQHFLHHPQPALELDDALTIPRRASTGTRLFQLQPTQDQKPRRVSISGPRPCMESSLATRNAPIRRRSFGTIRPCMENTNGDRPILRPYRQLSSDDLCVDMGCIGEETDEDLRSSRSNRSCLTSAVDFSNRSNRTGVVDFSVRSRNRAGSIDVSARSNRSAFRDLSTRSRTTVGLNEESSAATGVTTYPVVEEASSSSASPLPAEPEQESWQDKTAMKFMEDNPNFRRNKTWPTNLMRLLSIEQLAPAGDSDAKDDVTLQRRHGQSNSPYRDNRRLLRTIDIASEVVLDGRRLVKN